MRSEGGLIRPQTRLGALDSGVDDRERGVHAVRRTAPRRCLRAVPPKNARAAGAGVVNRRGRASSHSRCRGSRAYSAPTAGECPAASRRHNRRRRFTDPTRSAPWSAPPHPGGRRRPRSRCSLPAATRSRSRAPTDTRDRRRDARPHTRCRAEPGVATARAGRAHRRRPSVARSGAQCSSVRSGSAASGDTSPHLHAELVQRAAVQTGAPAYPVTR